MRPLLMMLGDYRSLTLNVVNRLTSVTRLFPNSFNDKFCDQMMVSQTCMMNLKDQTFLKSELHSHDLQLRRCGGCPVSSLPPIPTLQPPSFSPGDSQWEQSPVCPSRGGSRLSWDIRLFDYFPQREVGSIHSSFFLHLLPRHSDGYAKHLFILVLWPHSVSWRGRARLYRIFPCWWPS